MEPMTARTKFAAAVGLAALNVTLLLAAPSDPMAPTVTS